MENMIYLGYLYEGYDICVIWKVNYRCLCGDYDIDVYIENMI